MKHFVRSPGYCLLLRELIVSNRAFICPIATYDGDDPLQSVTAYIGT
jgi:hypothetical protein